MNDEEIMTRFFKIWNRTPLIKRIAIGVVIGLFLGLLLPKLSLIGLLGQMFVGGLKAIAPLLVFVLVANALSQHEEGQKSNMSTVIGLYLVGTFSAAFVAVLVNYIFPLTLTLTKSAETDLAAPQGIAEVFQTLLLKLVDNPINAIATANYIRLVR